MKLLKQIGTRLEKRRIKQIFGKIVDPATMETLLEKGIQREPLKKTAIEFILAYVNGDNPTEISTRAGVVADIAAAHSAIVHNMIGPLVIIAYGAAPMSAIRPGSRAALVGELHRKLTGSIKIVHGSTEGYCGLIGSESRMEYSFILPQFDIVLETVGKLEFGQVVKFPQ